MTQNPHTLNHFPQRFTQTDATHILVVIFEGGGGEKIVDEKRRKNLQMGKNNKSFFSASFIFFGCVFYKNVMLFLKKILEKKLRIPVFLLF